MKFSTIKLIIIIIFFNPFLYTQNSNQDLQLVYKEKIKNKIPEKNKLDRKKRIYWELSNKLFHRFTFNSHISKKNPANLAIKSPFYFFRFDPLNFDLQVTNKSLSPDFFINYFSDGSVLNNKEQDELIASFENLKLMTESNVSPLKLGIGNFQFSSNISTLILGDFEGEFFSIPFTNLHIENDYNQNLNLELFSYVKNSIGLGRVFKTNFASFRYGINYNNLFGLTYFKSQTNKLNFINNFGDVGAELNVSMIGSETFWGYLEDSMRTENINSYFSGSSSSFDVGFGVNLKKLIYQNLDLEILIENINSTLLFKNTTEKSYTSFFNSSNIIDFTDSLSNTTIDTISRKIDFKLKIPLKISMSTTYQPIPRFIISGGFEKYFNNFVIHNSKLNFHFRSAFYLKDWLNINYGISSRHNQIIQSFGAAVQSNLINIVLCMNSYNGFLNSANGIGFSINFSTHI